MIANARRTLIVAVTSWIFLGVISAKAQTPVERYGQLSVKGNRIVDKNGNPVQLQGMSLYWSMWKPAFYNENTIKWLRDDWCISVIRAAIGVDADGASNNQGGYKDNPTAEMNRITTVVDAAIKHGIYVIVDFHDHTASDKLPTAQKFFQDVSAKYKNVPNIIYETWNEPLAVSWPNVIKPYHEAVISTIRANDPDNIIICGTANWSQKVGDPKTDPIKGTNIAYTLHYYADSHKQWLRDAASAAMSGTNGIALFVTEYGTCAADGSGAINETESNAWYKFMADNSIGHCNWSVANLGETSAIIPTAVTAVANWPVSSLKPSGAFVRNYLRSKCNVVTALEELSTEAVIECYPNPFHDSFRINAKSAFEYEIYDLTGVKAENGNGINKHEVGASLPLGTYVVKITSATGNKVVKINKQ